MREDHPMGHGDSFQINIQDRPVVSPNDKVVTQASDSSEDTNDANSSDPPPRFRRDKPASSSDSQRVSGFTTHVHIFQVELQR